MKHPILTRLLSAGLAAALCVGAAGAALIDGGFTYSYRIGPGTTYQNTYAVNSAGTQRANAIEYTPSSDVSPMGVRAGTQFYPPTGLMHYFYTLDKSALVVPPRLQQQQQQQL